MRPFQWAESIKAAKKDSDESSKRALNGVLIANKTDLDETRRRISPKMGHEAATSIGLTYFECSAKDHKGVEEPFYFLANEWHKNCTSDK